MPRTVVAAAAALLCGSAFAASGVSGNFDGIYSGSLEPAPAMSGTGCPRFEVDALPVAQGVFKVGATDSHPAFEGFVTAEGFVQGKMRLPGGAPLSFEGRITDSRLSAGAFDDNAKCAWTANLTMVR